MRSNIVVLGLLGFIPMLKFHFLSTYITTYEAEGRGGYGDGELQGKRRRTINQCTVVGSLIHMTNSQLVLKHI
jgi:hypothetical protein